MIIHFLLDIIITIKLGFTLTMIIHFLLDIIITIKLGFTLLIFIHFLILFLLTFGTNTLHIIRDLHFLNRIWHDWLLYPLTTMFYFHVLHSLVFIPETAITHWTCQHGVAVVFVTA